MRLFGGTLSSVRTHHNRGIRCANSLEPPRVRRFDEQSRLCYALLGYIPGESGSDAIPRLPDSGQYEVGMDAGRELYAMHELRHPTGDFGWFESRVAKYEGKVVQAREHGLTFRGQTRVERYIETNMILS